MPTLKRRWTPHPAQRTIMADTTRFRIVAAGRRFGKTEMARHIAINRAWSNPNSNVWWVGPTYEDANELGYDGILSALPDAIVADHRRQSPRRIHLVNGSVISFRSGEREDSLRGRGLDFLVIDEAASVPSRAWKNELRPALADTLGDMLAIGTPKGTTGWFHEWFERGQDPDVPEVRSWQATTYDNPFVSDEEVESARAELPAFAFEQEFLAEFTTPSGLVYQSFDAEHDVVDEIPENVGRVFYGVDWGHASPAAIVAIIETRTGEYVVADEFYSARQTSRDLAEAAYSLQDEWGPGTFYCDPAESSSVAEFVRAGLDAVDADNSVLAGIQSVSTLFSRDALYIHERCENLIRELGNYRYPEVDDDEEPPEKPLKKNDHAVDSLRYGLFTGMRRQPNIGVIDSTDLWD